MDKLKSYLKNVKYTPFIPGLIVMLSAIVGIRMCWIAANLESAAALWVWGLVLYLPFYTHDLSKEKFCTRDSMVAAWILVPISIRAGRSFYFCWQVRSFSAISEWAAMSWAVFWFG